jgi:hypothetical protein
VSDKSKPRWYQFSLRTLMVAVGVAALVATWWNHRSYCLTRAGVHELYAIPIVTQLDSTFLGLPKEETLRHKRIAGEYRRAIWMPWLRLWIDDQEVAP